MSVSPIDTLLTQSLSPPSMDDVRKATPVASCLRSPYALSWRGQGQLYRHLLLFISRDSSAGVVTGRARNRGSIPGKDKRFISCSKRPHRLWRSTNPVFSPEFLLRETGEPTTYSLLAPRLGIIIGMDIIIFIHCNRVVTRWQWLFFMYTKHEIGYY